MRRYLSAPARREATVRGGLGLAPPSAAAPQPEAIADPPIRAGGGLPDIHPMRREGAKSFADDLVLGRGVVTSRAAASLRSVETQPQTRRFVRGKTGASPNTVCGRDRGSSHRTRLAAAAAAGRGTELDLENRSLDPALAAAALLPVGLFFFLVAEPLRGPRNSETI